MLLSKTVFNMSAIQKRVLGLDRLRLHYFANGMPNQLTKSEIKEIKSIIDADYKKAVAILDKSVKSAKA